MLHREFGQLSGSSPRDGDGGNNGLTEIARLRLRRVLGLRDLIVVAAAAIGPAFSLATVMASMVASAGRWTWLALVIVAVLMAMIAGGYKRLGERFGDAGSSYVWIRTAFGPVAGAYGAWVLIVANLFAVQATAIPAGLYTLDLIAPRFAGNEIAVALVAALWTLGSALLLWYGLRPTTMLALVLLAAEVIILAAAAVAAAIHPGASAVAFTRAPLTWGGFIGAIVIGVWMIDGWEVSASTAEEAKGESAAPGWGGLFGLALTTVLLLAAILAFTRIGSAAGFAAHGGDALAYIGELLGGMWGRLLTLMVLVSLGAALQATLIYLSRSLYAMGRDGILPRAIGALDHKREPAAAIGLITVLSIGFCLASALSPSAAQAFGTALNGTSWFLGALFVMSAGASVRLFRGGTYKWSAVVFPGIAAVVLGTILVVSLLQDDTGPRVFIAASAIIGLPLAHWRGRVVRRAPEARAGPHPGVAFERQRNRFDP